ncbi:hypothetical protein GGR39_000739 [Novosphingobium fluoreni]|uniref:Hedgehog/Intein (Hint) domain-containing protein n=1 Tax=Novosphingobium fluoreni TaxID=1391222 RepID=A0A7W6BZ46_9SPHN|nr:hypothetical protein [Novosphingobium fluoreni]
MYGSDANAISGKYFPADYLYTPFFFSSESATVDGETTYTGSIGGVHTAFFKEGSFTIIDADKGLVQLNGENYHIMGSSSDGQNLVMGTERTETIGSITSTTVYPSLVISNSGLFPPEPTNFATSNPYNTPNPVCYAEGTLLSTEGGYVAIESLAVGDKIELVDGSFRPIKWIGSQTVQCNTPFAQSTKPIRIRAHAFGEGRPFIDLVVSPGHRLMVSCIEDHLVRAELIVNGSSILIEEVDQVNYWHVELEQHAVVLANGLAAETYYDTGNRAFFTADGTMGHDADAEAHAPECLPSITGGHVLAAIRAVTMDRAARIEAKPPLDKIEVALAVGDLMVQPIVAGDHCLTFHVSELANDLRLISGVETPMWMDPASTDARSLGVLLTGLDVVDGDGTARSIQLSALNHEHGFHSLESDGTNEWRWTNGNATLPLALFEGLVGSLTLCFSYGRIAAGTMRREGFVRHNIAA